jgi:hypothetical protein
MLARNQKAPTERRLLNDMEVARLPLAGTPGAPPGAQYVCRDVRQAGFMVVVGRRDKTFTYQVDTTDPATGKRRTVKEAVGHFKDADHPEGMTTSEARKRAADAIAGVKTKRHVPVARRTGPTLRAAWEAYRRSRSRGDKTLKPGTIENYKDAIERSLASWLDTPLRELSEKPHVVKARFEEIIVEARTRRALPKRGQANEPGLARARGVMVVLRAVYNWSKVKLDESLPEREPTRMCDLDPLKRRQTAMSARELAGWGAQLGKIGSRVDKQGQQRGNPIRREYHLINLLTGARQDALSKARWEHLDLQRLVLAIPEDKVRPIDIPLSWAIVRALKRVRDAGRVLYPDSPWIFPAESDKGHIAEWDEVRVQLSHFGNDLRQTYITLSQEADVPDIDMKFLVGHALPGVTGGYRNRTKVSEAALRQKQEWLSRYLIRHLSLAFDKRPMRPLHPSANGRNNARR